MYILAEEAAFIEYCEEAEPIFFYYTFTHIKNQLFRTNHLKCSPIG